MMQNPLHDEPEKMELAHQLSSGPYYFDTREGVLPPALVGSPFKAPTRYIKSLNPRSTAFENPDFLIFGDLVAVG